MARTHGYSKLMTGDSCTRLAVKLMTSLALGRGAFLAWDTVCAQPPRPPALTLWPLHLKEHLVSQVQGLLCGGGSM